MAKTDRLLTAVGCAIHADHSAARQIGRDALQNRSRRNPAPGVSIQIKQAIVGVLEHCIELIHIRRIGALNARRDLGDDPPMIFGTDRNRVGTVRDRALTNATESFAVACAPWPKADAFLPDAVESLPTVMEPSGPLRTPQPILPLPLPLLPLSSPLLPLSSSLLPLSLPPPPPPPPPCCSLPISCVFLATWVVRLVISFKPWVSMLLTPISAAPTS